MIHNKTVELLAITQQTHPLIKFNLVREKIVPENSDKKNVFQEGHQLKSDLKRKNVYIVKDRFLSHGLKL